MNQIWVIIIIKKTCWQQGGKVFWFLQQTLWVVIPRAVAKTTLNYRCPKWNFADKECYLFLPSPKYWKLAARLLLDRCFLIYVFLLANRLFSKLSNSTAITALRFTSARVRSLGIFTHRCNIRLCTRLYLRSSKFTDTTSLPVIKMGVLVLLNFKEVSKLIK